MIGAVEVWPNDLISCLLKTWDVIPPNDLGYTLHLFIEMENFHPLTWISQNQNNFYKYILVQNTTKVTHSIPHH